MKNILFIHHNGSPGGAERSLLDLVTHLDKTQYKPIAILPSSGPLKDEFEQNGIKVIPLTLPILNNPLKKPLHIFKLLKSIIAINQQIKAIIKRKQIAIIHANSSKACLLCFWAAFLTKKPLLWHERDISKHPILYPFLSLFCTKIITISKAVLNNLRKQAVKPSKLLTIYNGINPMFFSTSGKSLSRKELALPEKKKLILMAAQFVPWKGHMDLILAAPKVITKHNNICFVLAGDLSKPENQNYVTKLKKLIQDNNLENHFIFPDFVNDMPSLLTHSSCVVLPSHNEPFGRIVIEAMAARRAIISYNSGGPKELITHQENGYLVLDGQPQKLADAIITFLESNQKATQMGNKGYQHVKQNFHIQQTVEHFSNLLQEILQS